ncbi:MAG: hypothetical protein ACPLXA_13260 [Moorellaceae bacterium]
MSFEEFAALVESNDREKFEKEDDLLDWRFAKETLEKLRKKKAFARANAEIEAGQGVTLDELKRSLGFYDNAL